MDNPPKGNLGGVSGKLDLSGDEITDVPKIQRMPDQGHLLHITLINNLADSHRQEEEPGKIPWEDANYVTPGPEPFTCGNCRFILFGVYGDDPEDQVEEEEGEPDRCQMVEGPWDGGIHPEDTCRLWCPKPDYLRGVGTRRVDLEGDESDPSADQD